jgi:DUF917 family protein
LGRKFYIAQVPKGRLIIRYIKSQEDHQRKMSFQEEFLALLKKHRVPYDARYLWE